MQDFEKNQQIQLSDGKTYLYVNTISVNEHNYHFLSPVDEESFVVGEMVHENGKKFFKRIQDKETIAKIQAHYTAHPDSLFID